VNTGQSDKNSGSSSQVERAGERVEALNWGESLLTTPQKKLRDQASAASFSVGAGGELMLSDEVLRRWGLSPGTQVGVEETATGIVLRPVDPPLAKVYVEPTSICNLRCRTCVRNSWSEPIGTMKADTFDRLMEALGDIRTVRSMHFWGIGEPLLHPGIASMIARARALGARTEMITNGLLLNRDMSAKLVEAGLDRIIFSIDGVSPEDHEEIRQGGNLAQVRENILGLHRERRARGVGNPEVGLEFVLMRRNVAQLPGLPALARSLGASFVVVTNVLPYTPELRDEILYGTWSGRTYPVARSLVQPEIVLPRLDGIGVVHQPLSELIESVGMYGAPIGGGERSLGYCRFINEGTAAVSWDGEVSPCVALMHSYPCYVLGMEKHIRRYSLGNVNKQPIGDIWFKEESVRFRAKVRAFDFAPCTDCTMCDLAAANEEDCLGNTFPVCGGCLWAKGVIQCP
jgi:MoaA/NifB/PqqE/SkfB family radical SAM enzyme